MRYTRRPNAIDEAIVPTWYKRTALISWFGIFWLLPLTPYIFRIFN